MVWGNLATGYWLGGAAAAGLQWIELGRKTLTGTSDNIDVTGEAADHTWTEDFTQNLASDYDSSEESSNQWQKFNATTDRLEFSHQQNNTWSAMTRDLTSSTGINAAFNTSKWSVRFKINFTELYGNDSRWSHAGFLLSSFSRTDVSTNNKYKAVAAGDNAIGVNFYNTTGGSAVRAWHCDNGSEGDDSGTQYTVSGDNAEEWYYIEISRDGANVTVKVWTDSYNGTLRVDKTWDLGTDWANGTGDPIKYFGIWSSEDQWGNSSYAVAGHLTELKYYNNVAPVVADLTAKPYMMILEHKIPSGNCRSRYRFNSDSGNNYAIRTSQNGGTDATLTSTNRLDFYHGGGDAKAFSTTFVSTIPTQEKLFICHDVEADGGAGAGNAPKRDEHFAKWANTADEIKSVNVYNDGTGDFGAGSEVVVLGYDPDDTEGGNVWAELSSDSLGSAGSTLTASFTAKKYLWCQIRMVKDDAIGVGIEFNSDTGTNYTYRRNDNGGTDSTIASDDEIFIDTLGSAAAGSEWFGNIFIINKQDQEKLCIMEWYLNKTGSGAGNAGHRREQVGKWANTSAQISSIRVTGGDGYSGNFGSGSSIKVWGFD